jgi:glycosyltransferase involved in cell wall biosynthesis
MSAGRPLDRGWRELAGVLVYGAAFAAASAATYLFNAILGRRLDAQDFSTFVALLAVLLALTGPSTALFGGGAMASARTGALPRMPWRGALGAIGGAALIVGFAPVGVTGRAIGWFALAAVLLMATSWYRGLLIGLGRLAFTGSTMVLEGAARIGFAVLLIERGYRVAGASAGLVLGISVGLAVTLVGLPRRSGGEPATIAPEVWVSIVGLVFIGLVQFVDIVAVRVAGGARVGDYAAASSLARMALYAQLPAAAYAIRRTAVVGAGAALRRIAILALAPGLLAFALLELFPGRILAITYGGYPQAAHLLRVLAIAMLLAGMATVAINVMLGAGRTGWVPSGSICALVGSLAVVLVSAHAERTAIVMTVVQAAVLAVAAIHLRRLLSAGRRGSRGVLILNWRDTRHPQGGGSEVFVEEIARRIAAAGRPVTIFCAEHPDAPRRETRDGVRFVRRGSWRTVYAWAAVYHLFDRFGPHEVVVDVQNAIPFFAPLYCGRPVVVLVHHVHREQWDMLFGRRIARWGWWVESRLAPAVYRRATYVTVSEATRSDLGRLGIEPSRVRIVHNGSPARPTSTGWMESPQPTVAYLGRLVPHKRIEFLIEAVAELREGFPGLRARIVGQGAWEPRLRAAAEAAGALDEVLFEGFVDGAAKRRILGESWVLALPSVQEGWGLAVVEAAMEGTPSVAFRVGGLQESVVDGVTGLLADDRPGFVEALRTMLASQELRSRMGAAARGRAAGFSWDRSARAFEQVLDRVCAGDTEVAVLGGAADGRRTPTVQHSAEALRTL